MLRRSALLLAALAVLAPAGAPAATAAAVPTDRHAVAGGCFAIAGLPGADGPLRVRPTRLGEHLLLTADGRYRTLEGTDAEPSRVAEWGLEGSPRDGARLTHLASGRALPVRFAEATGCATFPDVGTDAEGTPLRGASPTATARGTVDAHNHIATFEIFGGEWHCGRPWHPYGIPYALRDCSPQRTGTNGLFADVLETGSPVPSRDRVGWPTFRGWPRHDGVASEGEYHRALERAWMGGVRLMVSHAVDNEALCQVMTTRRRACDDMDSARAQLRALHELEDYVDAQAGGPGKGFFRVVEDPFEARAVVNAGKLAVVKGIEVSDLFGCGQRGGDPACTAQDVDRGVEELGRLGVATVFPVHKFDNAFGGTKMDPGEQGVIVEAGNVLTTGRFWDVETCPTEHRDNDLTGLPAGGAADLLAAPLRELAPGGAVAPVRPATPHCNVRGLTDLGRRVVGRLADAQLIVEADHLGARTAEAVLEVLERRGHAGVVSSHFTESQLDPVLVPRILRLGGFVAPVSSATIDRTVRLWRLTVEVRRRLGLRGGVGFSSDMNGLARQSPPGRQTGNVIAYPFRSLDGRVTFRRSRWGQRTFDVNEDGVAHYGLYPDHQEQLVRAAGPEIGADLLRGVESYLQMWERTRGIGPPRCVRAAARVTSRGLGPLRLGASAEQVLRAAGQPAARPGRRFRFCVAGRRSARVAFDARGRVDVVARTSRSRAPRALRDGLHVSAPRRGGARFVRRVRGGRLAWTAVVDRRAARTPATLRAALRRTGLR